MTVRGQIFHDMALAISQLHDCGIVHHGVNENYFKVMIDLHYCDAKSSITAFGFLYQSFADFFHLGIANPASSRQTRRPQEG